MKTVNSLEVKGNKKYGNLLAIHKKSTENADLSQNVNRSIYKFQLSLISDPWKFSN